MRYEVGDKVEMIEGEILNIKKVDRHSKIYLMSDNNLAKDADIKGVIETFSSIKELIKLEKQDNNKYKQHEDICKQLNEIYISKNKDYGDSFLKVRKEYPEAVIIRLMDKLERLKTLYKGQEQLVNDESITDSLMDMANYCIMEVMEVEKNV